MYYDLHVHEKSLDGVIELIQKDQFDENSNLEQLEKMCSYIQVDKKNTNFENMNRFNTR